MRNVCIGICSAATLFCSSIAYGQNLSSSPPGDDAIRDKVAKGLAPFLQGAEKYNSDGIVAKASWPRGKSLVEERYSVANDGDNSGYEHNVTSVDNSGLGGARSADKSYVYDTGGELMFSSDSASSRSVGLSDSGNFTDSGGKYRYAVGDWAIELTDIGYHELFLNLPSGSIKNGSKWSYKNNTDEVDYAVSDTYRNTKGEILMVINYGRHHSSNMTAQVVAGKDVNVKAEVPIDVTASGSYLYNASSGQVLAMTAISQVDTCKVASLSQQELIVYSY